LKRRNGRDPKEGEKKIRMKNIPGVTKEYLNLKRRRGRERKHDDPVVMYEERRVNSSSQDEIREDPGKKRNS